MAWICFLTLNAFFRATLRPDWDQCQPISVEDHVHLAGILKLKRSGLVRTEIGFMDA